MISVGGDKIIKLVEDRLPHWEGKQGECMLLFSNDYIIK